MNNYSQTELKRLYDKNLIENSKIYKDYFLSFFYPLTDGTHAFTENNEVTIIQNDIMQRVYLARISKEIKIWYETMVVPRKTISLIRNDVKNLQHIIKEQNIEINSLKQIIKKQNDKLLNVNEDLKLAIKQIEQVDKYFQSLEVEETETELHPTQEEIDSYFDSDESEHKQNYYDSDYDPEDEYDENEIRNVYTSDKD